MKKRNRVLCILLSILLSIQMCSCLVLADTVPDTALENASDSVSDAPMSEDKQLVGELTEKRSAYEKYYAFSDRSETAVIYPQAVHFQDTEGVWQDIDNTLSEALDEGEAVLQNKENLWNIKFSKKAKDGKLIKLKYGSHNIKWYLQGAEKTEGEPLVSDVGDEQFALPKVSSGMRYKNIIEGVDLEYLLLGNELKENIVLQSASAVQDFTFVYETGALMMRLEDNVVTLYDGDEPVISLQAPVMVDAAGEESFALSLSLVSLKDNPNNHSYALTLSPDKAWLSDTARVYPVVIDPTVTTDLSTSAITDTYVSSAEGTSSFGQAPTVKIGMNGTSKVYRGYLKFAMPEGIGDTDRVIGATLRLYPYSTTSDFTTMAEKAPVIEAHEVTANWSASSLNWNNQPAFNSKILDCDRIQSLGSDSAYRWYTWDITSLVDSWCTEKQNYGVMLKYDNEQSYGSTMVANFVSAQTDISTTAYPAVQISYLNMLGLENYWTYHSVDVGNAGTAYINDFTGAMTLITPLCSVASEVMPIDISLVYSPGSFTTGSGATALGVGRDYFLNVQSHILEEVKDGKTRYKYFDGDGTIHYFEQKDNKWVDDGGLGLTFDPNTDYWQITDKQDNKIQFYKNNGRLFQMLDNSGNYLRMAYTVNNNVDYYLSSITNGYHTVTISRYTENNQQHIKLEYPDSDNKTRYALIVLTQYNNMIEHIFQYVDVNGTYQEQSRVGFISNSKAITDVIDGTYNVAAHFDYNEIIAGDPNRRVVSYKKQQYLGDGDFGAVDYEYDVEYNDKMTYYYLVTGPEIREEVYCFDAFGRTISAQDAEGNAVYQSYGLEGGAKNKVTFTSDTQRSTLNLVDNHNFEMTTSAMPKWAKYGGENDDAAVKTAAQGEPVFVGNRSMKVYKHSASETKMSDVAQFITLEGGKTYTLSAYVYTDFDSLASISTAGAFLGVENGNYSRQFYNHAIQSDGKWTRHFVTIDLRDVEIDEDYAICLGINRAKGAAYFDGVQVEEGSSVNSYNLLENGDFSEMAGDGWVGTQLESGDQIVDFYGYNTTLGYRIYGNPKKAKKLTQTIAVGGKKGDSFTAGVWVKSETLPDKDTEQDGTRQTCAMTLEICRDSGSHQYVTSVIPSSGDGWYYLSLGATANFNYTDVKLHLKYNYNANTVYFDNARLCMDAFGSTYQYDSKGNLIRSVSRAGDKNDKVVNANNDVTSTTDGNGNTQTFVYDEGNLSTKKHQLTSTTTPNGAETKTTYNNNGNPTESLTTSVGGLKMRTTTDYTSEGHYVSKETDTAGVSTQYLRDSTTGRLDTQRTVTNNGEYLLDTNYTYDPLTKQLSEVSLANYEIATTQTQARVPRVTYTYDKGNLTDITRYENQNKVAGYHMAYDAFGRTTSVAWSGKNNTENLLQNTEYIPGLGLVRKVTYGNGQYLEYTYNNAGMLLSRSANGQVVARYDYNASNNLGSVSYYSPSKEGWETSYFFYDLAGRSTGSKDTRGYSVSEIAYDGNENILSFTSSLKDSNVDLSYATDYTYNNMNALTKLNLRVPGDFAAGTIRYGYDGLGRMNAKKALLVADDTSTDEVDEKYIETTFTYGTHSYTPANSNTAVTLRTLRPSTTHVKDNYNSSVDVEYYDTYYPDGSLKRNRTKENGATRYTYFYYDKVGQLIQQYCSYDKNIYNYEYDESGNITGTEYLVDDVSKYTTTYAYDPNYTDLLTSFSKTENGVTTTKSYTYATPSGSTFVNPTTISETKNGVTTSRNLTWQQGRQLTQIQGVATYEYNQDGLRTQTLLEGGAKRQYYYNGDRLEYVKIFNASGALTRTLHYIYNSSGQAEYIQYIDAAQSHNPKAYYLYYIVRDNTGVIQKLVCVRKPNSSQTDVVATLFIAAEYTYDPFGKLLSTTTYKGHTIGNQNPLRYKDYIYDTETGWYYLQSRYYDPEIGRFINGDGYASTGQGIIGTNMFAYCGNDPINHYDPTGEYRDNFGDEAAALFGEWLGHLLFGFPSKKEHYARNKMQEDVIKLDPKKIIESDEWERQPDNKNIYHRHKVGEQGDEAKYNVKYMTKDKRKEVIINFAKSEPRIVTDPYNIGTYNFGTSVDEHVVWDVLPYYIWGNSPVDSGIGFMWDRVFGAGK